MYVLVLPCKNQPYILSVPDTGYISLDHTYEEELQLLIARPLLLCKSSTVQVTKTKTSLVV